MTVAARRSCALEIDRLGKSYGPQRVVEDLSLHLPRAETLALLGPSGCGKTTVLQAIAGFVTPDAGDIRLDGHSILAVPPEKRGTAMLFQHYALFPHMSVAENVGFGLRMARVPKPEAAARVRAALALVRIEALADRRPAQLSGGQRQRVALARAVVTEPRLLLLDEPLGALDQNLREEMQTELRKLQAKLGLTTVLVTHDQHEAVVLADRVAVMRAGRIEQVGAPLDIYDRPRTPYVAAFTGVENMLPAHGAGGAVALAGVTLPGLSAPAAGPVIVAARASSVVLRPRGAAPGALAGTVNFMQVLGSAIRYEVALPHGATIIAEEPRRDGIQLALGASVEIALPPERCTVFDAGNG